MQRVLILLLACSLSNGSDMAIYPTNDISSWRPFHYDEVVCQKGDLNALKGYGTLTTFISSIPHSSPTILVPGFICSKTEYHSICDQGFFFKKTYSVESANIKKQLLKHVVYFPCPIMD